VKSTQSHTASVRIKLSNGLKLAKNPLPCFTALVIYAADGKTPTKIYLQHFDQPQIAQALKSARQAHVDGNTALNRKTITLNFTPDELTPENEFVSRMLNAIPAPAIYGSTKNAFVSSVGYENGFAKGKLSFSREHVGDFIDAMLGKGVQVPVKNMSVHEQRFGIVDAKAKLDGSGKIQVTPKPFKACQVVVRHPELGEQIVLQGDLFVPGIPNLPEEYRRMRVRTDILEFTCGLAEDRKVAFGDFAISFDTEARTSIDRINQFATLWSWIGPDPLELELWIDGTRFLHGQVETNANEDKAYWRALHLVTSALAKFVDKELRPPNLEFALSDFSPLKPLIEFAELIRGAGITMRFGIDGEFPIDLRSYITPIFFELGTVLFFAVARYTLKNAVVAGHSVTLELANPVLYRKTILTGSLADNAEFAREATRAVERSCQESGEEIVFGFLPDALQPSNPG
jgi:hypothetical protein